MSDSPTKLSSNLHNNFEVSEFIDEQLVLRQSRKFQVFPRHVDSSVPLLNVQASAALNERAQSPNIRVPQSPTVQYRPVGSRMLRSDRAEKEQQKDSEFTKQLFPRRAKSPAKMLSRGVQIQLSPPAHSKKSIHIHAETVEPVQQNSFLNKPLKHSPSQRHSNSQSHIPILEPKGTLSQKIQLDLLEGMVFVEDPPKPSPKKSPKQYRVVMSPKSPMNVFSEEELHQTILDMEASLQSFYQYKRQSVVWNAQDDLIEGGREPELKVVNAELDVPATQAQQSVENQYANQFSHRKDEDYVQECRQLLRKNAPAPAAPMDIGSADFANVLEHFFLRSGARCSVCYSFGEITKITGAFFCRSRSKYYLPFLFSNETAQELSESEEVTISFYDGENELVIRAQLTARWQDHEDGQVHRDVWDHMSMVRRDIPDKNDPEYTLFEVQVGSAVLKGGEYQRQFGM